MRSDFSEDVARLGRYVERYFQRKLKTEFPTVRQCANALKIGVSEVEQRVEDSGGAMMLTRYNTIKEPPLGEFYVETLNEGDFA